MLRFSVALASATALAALGVSVAEEGFKSGIQPGKSVSPFNVKDITGPNKGQSLCYT